MGPVRVETSCASEASSPRQPCRLSEAESVFPFVSIAPGLTPRSEFV